MPISKQLLAVTMRPFFSTPTGIPAYCAAWMMPAAM
jgi:hypothetical protein